ncbi:MAG: hypothetical protein QNJ54_08565 [Prochloraceae cyanobacterium]|nr:hypothetical protein [Prochloraceae cyanobacterium]
MSLFLVSFNAGEVLGVDPGSIANRNYYHLRGNRTRKLKIPMRSNQVRIGA